MPIYRYRAVDPSGDVAMGELEAANEGEIVERLRDQGMLPMQVGPASATRMVASASVSPALARRPFWVSKTVTRDQLGNFTRELATLLKAGLPLDRALEVLIQLAQSPAVGPLLQQIRDDVRGGKALSQALDAH